jgi:hypothetical protein
MPSLYRIVNLYPDLTGPNVAIQLSLYHNLQNPQISELITEFRVTLFDDFICATRTNSTGVWPPSLGQCSCDSYNRALGRALILMKNLRVLSIHCRLCFLKHSHDYLYHLETRTLAEFQFQCFRSNIPVQVGSRTSSILLAPCMSSITALALECDYDTLTRKTDGYDQIKEMGEILPGLRIMSYTGGSLCASLLANRPIERLCALGQPTVPLHELISLSPGKLSHLFMFNLIEFLHSALTLDFAPYLHLRYIGTITFNTNAVS